MIIFRSLPVSQRTTSLESHHVIGNVVDVVNFDTANILNVKDIVTVTSQLAHRTGFLGKPLKDFGIVILEWEFQHHDAVVGARVGGFPHRTHPAFIQFFDDLVAVVD